MSLTTTAAREAQAPAAKYSLTSYQHITHTKHLHNTVSYPGTFTLSRWHIRNIIKCLGQNFEDCKVLSHYPAVIEIWKGNKVNQGFHNMSSSIWWCQAYFKLRFLRYDKEFKENNYIIVWMKSKIRSREQVTVGQDGFRADCMREAVANTGGGTRTSWPAHTQGTQL